MLQTALPGGKFIFCHQIMEVFVRRVDIHVSEGYCTNYVIELSQVV